MSGWIKCSDRLPESGEPVLIRFENGDHYVGALFWDEPIQPEETFDPYRYWDDPENNGCDWSSEDVTHWHPLPSPPTE